MPISTLGPIADAIRDVAANKRAAKLPVESEKITDFLNRRVAEIGHISQMILFMDSAGVLRAEMPGPNGARQKVDLPPGFKKRNPEIMDLLTRDQENHRKQSMILADLRQRNQSTAHDTAEAELAERNNALDEAARKRAEWLDSLPVARREIELAKIDEKLAATAKAANERAKGLYYYVVENHSLRLANRVVPDRERRPRGKITISIGADGTRTEISPRTDTVTVGGKKIDPSLALDL